MHYSLDQVQLLTDHARRDSVKRYAVLHRLGRKEACWKEKAKKIIYYNCLYLKAWS